MGRKHRRKSRWHEKRVPLAQKILGWSHGAAPLVSRTLPSQSVIVNGTLYFVIISRLKFKRGWKISHDAQSVTVLSRNPSANYEVLNIVIVCFNLLEKQRFTEILKPSWLDNSCQLESALKM